MAFCLPSSAGLLCAVLGALRVGVVPVLLNATLLDAERDELIADADPARRSPTPIAWPRSTRAAGRARPVSVGPAHALHVGDHRAGQRRVVGAVGRGHAAEAAFDDEADLWSFGPDDVHLVCSPMYHSVSIRFAAGTLLRGGTCVILSRFDAAVAAAALRVEHGPCPPPRSWPLRRCSRLLDVASDRD